MQRSNRNLFEIHFQLLKFSMDDIFGDLQYIHGYEKNGTLIPGQEYYNHTHTHFHTETDTVKMRIEDSHVVQIS